MKCKYLPYSILKYNRLGVKFKLPESELNLNFETLHLLKHLNKDVRISWTRGLNRLSDLILLEKPLSYVVTDHPFLNAYLSVQSKVLIPRNETEEIVFELIQTLQSERGASENRLRVLDICSGSGCIALALACNVRNVEITAVDKFQRCYRSIKKNIFHNNHLLEANSSIVIATRADVFDSNFFKNQKFDLIISNPPYISLSQKHKIAKNVLKFESHSSLIPPSGFRHGISFHSRILSLSNELLNSSTQNTRIPKIVLEFDGKYQVKYLKKELKCFGFLDFKIKNDFRKVPRSLWVY